MNLQQQPQNNTETKSAVKPKERVASMQKTELTCSILARLCQRRWMGIDDIAAIQKELGMVTARRSTQRIISGLLKSGVLILHPRQRHLKCPSNLTFGLNPNHPDAGALLRMAYPDRLVD